MSQDDNTNERIIEAKKLIQKVSEIIKDVSDSDAAEILGDGCLDLFLRSILDPEEIL